MRNLNGLLLVAALCSCGGLSEDEARKDCSDRVLDGFETDLDCGGRFCAPLGFLCANGQRCGNNTDCQNGQCRNGVCFGCGAGTTECGGVCVDVTSDANNCGQCGKKCPDGTPHCFSGRCLTICGGTTSECPGEKCYSLGEDPNNCGACGLVCARGLECHASSCQCPAGTMDCAGCVDVNSDPKHCGDCKVVCKQNMVCNAGACASSCGSLTNCGGACVNTASDVRNCGDCDKACLLANAIPACKDGACQVGSCVGQFDDCNHKPEDGCETDIMTDTNCGKCGQPCDTAHYYCLNGACQYRCGDKLKNGNETDVDCGGKDDGCNRCDDGKMCLADSDCKSANCAGGRCAPPLVAMMDMAIPVRDMSIPPDQSIPPDLTQYPDLTPPPDLRPQPDLWMCTGSDVNCGGNCVNKCANGKVCKVPADCQSGYCAAKQCVANEDSIYNLVQNGGNAVAIRCNRADKTGLIVPDPPFNPGKLEPVPNCYDCWFVLQNNGYASGVTGTVYYGDGTSMPFCNDFNHNPGAIGFFCAASMPNKCGL